MTSIETLVCEMADSCRTVGCISSQHRSGCADGVLEWRSRVQVRDDESGCYSIVYVGDVWFNTRMNKILHVILVLRFREKRSSSVYFHMGIPVARKSSAFLRGLSALRTLHGDE